MATEALKTTVITNRDASPAVRTLAGKGGEGRLILVDGTLTGTTAVTSGSTYRLCRVPSNAIIKRVRACLDIAVTNFQADIGVYYGSGADVPADLRSDVIDADLFASAVDFDSVIVPTEYTMESTQLSAAEMLKELWDVLGLSADPHCSFDIVFTATETTDGAPIMYCAVEYVLAGG